MAEPQIQYAHTIDGVNIAYYAIGSGPPLISTSANLGMAISKEWDVPVFRRIAELSSRVFTYVRFDPHGSGMSDRADADLSVESYVRDLEAVADAAAPDRFALFANGMMTAPAIVYAARHADRLTHLILWIVYAHQGDLQTPHREQIVNLALTDWRAATESGTRAVDNWEHDEMASQMAAITRESVTPETFVKFEKEWPTWDVSEYLPEITTPTLIIHPRNHPYYGPDAARRVAAAIPGARLSLVESSTVLFPDAKIPLIAGEFLGTVPPRSEQRPPVNVARSGTAVILFADIADSTALTERMGDTSFREKARALDEALRIAVRDNGGAVIDAKTLGDGILATFPAASQAIASALACGAAGDAQGLPLHLGLHAGDVIRESDNVFGGAVNIAARISALSAPGEVLVSRTVADLARTSAGVTFEDRGGHALKGVGEPQRVYAVRPNT